jgi:hypothetical protein
MRITLVMLLDENADRSFLEWFIKHFGVNGSPDHTEIMYKLYTQDELDTWDEYLITTFKLTQKVKGFSVDYEANYVNGLLHGEEIFNFPDGSRDKINYYIHGIEVTKQEWEEYEEDQK